MKNSTVIGNNLITGGKTIVSHSVSYQPLYLVQFKNQDVLKMIMLRVSVKNLSLLECEERVIFLVGTS
jgi:hypothetical protein